MQLKAKAKAKAKTVKEMAAGWKKTRDEPVPDDHAEGEGEEPIKRRMQQLLMMSIEATPR